MFSARVQTIVALAIVGLASAFASPQGGISKSGEGERLPGERQTLVKASPSTGTQGVEMFRDTMLAGTSTGVHLHQQADEFFYVISGQGIALLDGAESLIGADDVVFVPRGHDHRVKSTGPMPLEIVFLVDKPGLACDFREARSNALAKTRRLTLEEWNQISHKYGTVHKTIE